MRAIDRIIGHWQATRHKRLMAAGCFRTGDHDDGIDVYWDPWTIGEQDRCFAEHEMRVDAVRQTVQLPPAAFARILVVKALDKDGKRLFSDAEEFELLTEASPREVRRVATLMIASLSADNAAGRPAGQDGEGDGDPKAPTSGASPGTST